MTGAPTDPVVREALSALSARAWSDPHRAEREGASSLQLIEAWAQLQLESEVACADAMGNHLHRESDAGAGQARDSSVSADTIALAIFRATACNPTGAPRAGLSPIEMAAYMAVVEQLLSPDTDRSFADAVVDALTTCNPLEALLQFDETELSVRQSAATKRLEMLDVQLRAAVRLPGRVNGAIAADLRLQIEDERAYLADYASRWPTGAPQMTGAAAAAIAALDATLASIDERTATENQRTPARREPLRLPAAIGVRFTCGFDGSVDDLLRSAREELDGPPTPASVANLRRVAEAVFMSPPNRGNTSTSIGSDACGAHPRRVPMPEAWAAQGVVAYYMRPPQRDGTVAGRLFLAADDRLGPEAAAAAPARAMDRALAREVYPGTWWMEAVGARAFPVAVFERTSAVAGWQLACDELAVLHATEDATTAILEVGAIRRRTAALAIADISLFSSDRTVADAAAGLAASGGGADDLGLVGAMQLSPGAFAADYVAYRSYRRVLETWGKDNVSASEVERRLRDLAAIGFVHPNVVLSVACGATRF